MKRTVASSAFKQKTPSQRRIDALPGTIFSTIDRDIPQGGFYDLHGTDIAHPDPIIEAETLPASNQLAAILVHV
jgi:hypothetical protein